MTELVIHNSYCIPIKNENLCNSPTVISCLLADMRCTLISGNSVTSINVMCIIFFDKFQYGLPINSSNSCLYFGVDFPDNNECLFTRSNFSGQDILTWF